MPSLEDLPPDVVDRITAFFRKRVCDVRRGHCFACTDYEACSDEHDVNYPFSESCEVRATLALVSKKLACAARQVPCYCVRFRVPPEKVGHCKALNSIGKGFDGCEDESESETLGIARPEILVCDEYSGANNGVLEMYAVGASFAYGIGLPTSVERLHLEVMGAKCLRLSDFSNLRELVLGDSFDAPLLGLPPALKKLRFGCNFDHPLTGLPASLTHLWLGICFDQPIKPGDLPPRLQELDLGDAFERVLPPLPPMLTYLRMSSAFNLPIAEGILPDSIEDLVLGCFFSQPLPTLPKNLKYLRVSEYFKDRLNMDEMPESLRVLFMGIQYRSRNAHGEWGSWHELDEV